MKHYSPNIEIFRDIATAIDINDLCNMDRIFEWKVDENNHVWVRIHNPSRPAHFIAVRFQGGGIIHMHYTILNLNEFYYSPSACQAEFKRILADNGIKL